MLKDFKEFALKGNVMDLAIGVIIGGAFGKIVSSLVNDIIMPIFSALIGKVDFSDMSLPIGEAAINYGLFINTIIEFLIISFSIFIAIRQLSKLSKKEEVVVEVTTKECPYCITEVALAATRCPNCTSVLE